MVSEWQKLKSEMISNERIFRVRHDTSRSPRTGLEHTFVILESPDWINIIPITPEGNVVLIHQYRHGNEQVTLEIPGGLVDREDPSPLETARRELLEETGYAAEKIVHIGTMAPNPAFLNNLCFTYLALGASQIQAPELDGSEDIVVQEFPLSEIPQLISSGKITHSLVIAGFYHLIQYQKEK